MGLISLPSDAQNTFYKYLYHDYNSGRHKSIASGVVLQGDTLVSHESIWGHGVNGGSVSFFDAKGQRVGTTFQRDTAFIPDSLSQMGTTFPLKTQEGYLIGYNFGWRQYPSVSSLAYYNKSGTLLRQVKTKPKSSSELLLAQVNSSFGTLIYDQFDTITYRDKMGVVKHHIKVSDHIKVKPNYPNLYKTVVDASSNYGFYAVSNVNDSCQILRIDTLGKVAQNNLFLGLKIHDFRIWKDLIITVEEDTSLQIVFRNLDFKEVNRYSFSNEFPLIYNRLVFKDSLVSVVVYNNVNGAIYGTNNIPEIRVINLNGDYLRRRYLRYNGGYKGIIPWNAIGIVINGIDFTSDNGYYMTLNMDGGTLDSRYGILKTDSNVMTDDTIFVPGVRLYLNQWDTTLTPMPKDTNTSIPEIKKDEILVYPNPTSSQLHIQSEEQFNTASIYDMTGRLVKEEKIGSNQTIDVSFFPKGQYLLELESAKGIIRKNILVE